VRGEERRWAEEWGRRGKKALEQHKIIRRPFAGERLDSRSPILRNQSILQITKIKNNNSNKLKDNREKNGKTRTAIWWACLSVELFRVI